jgi:prevent-host-death family protein
VNVVSIRDLSRNPSAVVDEVERSGRPALVTRNGKPIAALVRIDQDRLEEWLQSTVGDPPIGESLEETPQALRASARPGSSGKRQSGKKSRAKDAAFLAALAE